MNDLYDCISKYHLSINKIKKTSHYTILYGKENYLWRKKIHSKKELFDYFERIEYPYYLPILNDYEDSYELYPYFDAKIDDKFLKGQKMIEAISFLHNKSMNYENMSEKDILDIYENIDKKIQDTQKYYEDLQDYIEQFSFPRVDYYLLINHMSLFYRSLFTAKNLLEDWYQSKPNKMHKSYVIHNASFENFRFHDKSYFLDYDECSYDYMINDFVSFYKKDALNTDMKSLFKEYTSSVSLDTDEKKLLFCLLLIPKKLEFSSHVYANTVMITKELDIINKTFNFISEKDEENEEADKKEF